MMKKVIVLITAVFIFLFLFTASSSAQFFYEGYNSLLSGALSQSDWQLDYLQPLDPAELEKGEYRFSPIIARVSTSGERTNYPDGDLIDEYDESTMIYGAVFDTAISDRLTIHGKYIYQPWEDYYDSYYVSASATELDYESRMSLLDLFINYEIKEDNTLYFGYNRMLNKEKDYWNGELEDEEEDTINFYYIGYEMRGKFTGSSD